MKRIISFLFCCMATVFVAGAQTSFGEASLFNDSWTFKHGDDQNASKPEFDDSKWQKLTLPHDWSVKGTLSPDLASCTGYLPGGIA